MDFQEGQREVLAPSREPPFSPLLRPWAAPSFTPSTSSRREERLNIHLGSTFLLLYGPGHSDFCIVTVSVNLLSWNILFPKKIRCFTLLSRGREKTLQPYSYPPALTQVQFDKRHHGQK